MELENLEQITPEGLHVFMPSGTDATLYKDNDFIIVEYPELYRDKYTKEQFTKLMEEGIQIMNPPSQEVMESKKEPTLLEQFIAKGYIRPSLAEAYEKAKRKEGDVFKAMNDKDVEYLTPEFKNELLTMLDEIAKAYPDVKVRQQATTFMDALGLQEYYGTKAMKDFANKYIKLLHTHVNESVNEAKDWRPYKFTIDYEDGRPEDIIEYGMDAEDAKQNLFKSHKYLQDKPERVSDGEPVKEDHEEVTLPFTMIHRSSEGPDASGEVTFFPTAFGYEYQCTEKDFNGRGPKWSTIRTIEGIKIWFRNVLFEFGAKIVTIGDETWDIDDFPKNEAYHPAYDNNRYYVTFDGCEGQVFYAKSEEEAKELARKDFFTKDFEITGVEYLGKLGEPKNEALDWTDKEFCNQMLGRLIQDCNYFINNPNPEVLWAKDIDEQIDCIKKCLKVTDRKIPEEKIAKLKAEMLAAMEEKEPYGDFVVEHYAKFSLGKPDKVEYINNMSLEDVIECVKDMYLDENIKEYVILKDNKTGREIARKDWDNTFTLKQNESVNEEDKFRYDGKIKIKQITKDEWDKTPNDYKMIRNGQKYIMYLDKDTQATVLGRCEIVGDSLNEMNDRTVYNVKKARAQRFRDSGYSREEGVKFGKNDTLYNQRIQSKGLSIEDGIDNLVNIGFDKLSAYKASVVKVVKEIMARACELGLAEPYDFGKGKGKFRCTDGNIIEDVVNGLLDDKKAREIAMNYVNKQNKGAGLPLRTDESLKEGVHWDYEYDADDLMADAPVNTPKTEIPDNNFTQEDIDYILNGIVKIGKEYGFEEFEPDQTDDEYIGKAVKNKDGIMLSATYYPSAPGFGERWAITLYDNNFEDIDFFEPQKGRSWNNWTNDEILYRVRQMFETPINESLNEEQGPYFGNDAIGDIAMEIEAGNKSGYEPTEFGNWILITNMDTKWEAITEPAKDFLLEKIAILVADGNISKDNVEIDVDEDCGIAKDDLASFNIFSDEQLDNIFIEGNEDKFEISFELQFDGQLGESFKVKKCKKDKKKLDEVDNIDYFVKSVEGENGPFASREAAANYITQQVLAGKNEADFEIITNNGEEKMEENKKAPELVTESYKVYNTVGAEVAGENTFNSWEEVNNFLQQEWGTYKASMIAENPEFGTEEDEGNFLGNYEVEIIEVPAEMEVQVNPDVCPECGEAECICEPCEDNKCPECGCEPCECEKEVLEAPVDVVEDFEDEHIGKSDDEQEEVEETEEVVTPEQAAEVIDKVEDAIDSLEDFINMLVDNEELTQEEQDEIEALDLPAVVEQPEETPVDESLKEDTTVLDNGKEFKVDDKAFDIVRKNLLDVMRGYGWVDVEQMQDYIKEEGLELTDEELIAVAKTCLKYTRIFDASELQDTDLQDIKDAYGTVIVVGNFKRLPKNEEVKPEPPVEDDKNEDFKDGMLTDVKDLDMPDAIAQAIDVNDDGTVMRLTDIMAEVKALKAEMEKALVDFKTDMKDILNTVKQDIQRDVNDVENKVDDTQDAVDDLVVEEEGVEEELPPEEETTEPAEEAPVEEEQEEKEEVEEAYEPTGNVIIDTTAQILREEKVSLQGLYKKLSAKGIAPTPLTKTLVEKYITTNKLSKTLLKEEEDESLISLNDGEIKSKDPAIKKFCNKGVLEDLVDTKKKADEVIAQGGTAQDVKNAIDMYAADDNEAKQAKDYAINKMKESLLNTKKNSKLSIRGILE